MHIQRSTNYEKLIEEKHDLLHIYNNNQGCKKAIFEIWAAISIS